MTKDDPPSATSKASGSSTQQQPTPLVQKDVPENFEDASATPGREVWRVGAHLPPFWPSRPSVWFNQVEGQFILAGITQDSTKFYHIVSQLEHQYASEIEDIIENPPKENKYGTLKTELIRRLSASQEQKVKQLLMHEELGNRKPSQFLRHLIHLAGPNMPDNFVRTIWSSRLPQHIQAIIASQVDVIPLDKLAELADKVNDISSPNMQITEVASTSATAAHYGAQSPVLEAMANQIAALTKQVASLTTMVQKKHHSRSRSRSRYGRSQSRSNSRSYTTCWYHRKFGANAKKCTSPCDQSGNAKSSH